MGEVWETMDVSQSRFWSSRAVPELRRGDDEVLHEVGCEHQSQVSLEGGLVDIFHHQSSRMEEWEQSRQE
jgi:hypothetical protein